MQQSKTETIMKKKTETDYRWFNNTTLLPGRKRKNKKKESEKYAIDNTGTLDMARRAWEELDSHRRERTRNRDYTFGRQWNDSITLADGRTITEEQYLKEQGKVPLKNNLIRQLVKNVVGQFRSTQTHRNYEFYQYISGALIHSAPAIVSDFHRKFTPSQAAQSFAVSDFPPFRPVERSGI